MTSADNVALKGFPIKKCKSNSFEGSDAGPPYNSNCPAVIPNSFDIFKYLLYFT